MTNVTTRSFPDKTIGIDLGDRISHFTIRGANGDVTQRGKIKTTPEMFSKFLAYHQGKHIRAVYEAGTHSLWVTWLAQELGLETVVANTRELAMISQSQRKTDRRDADLLSEFGYLRPSVLCPIQHRSRRSFAHRALVRARATLVAVRTDLTNAIRGLVKPTGTRVTSSVDSFHKTALQEIPKDLRAHLEPLLDTLRDIAVRIATYDKQIRKLAKECYPETQRLEQVKGVGPITSLCFVLTIEDPTRFAKSRDVGAYLGLVPKLRSSGDAAPELRITKAGDRQMRSLLVLCAQYMLGHFGEDCDLRRYGERIAAGGGKNAKKRAIVAVARKLAILLHRLWVTGAEYEPLRHANRGLAA